MGQLWKLCAVPAGVACPQAGDGSSVLDLRYGYDVVGNITSLRDKTGGADELQSYTYDDLDRLTGVSGPYSRSYNYNAIGNLTYRSDVGAYSYNSGRPHAVTAAGSHSYGYDANGNMINRDGDSLTYDAENRLESVTTGGQTITFTYDGDGRRVMRDTVTDTVAYIGPHYELRFDKASKPEDLDDDCRITVIDIMRVARRWGQAGGPEDVNGDGTVDVGDVQQVAGQWRETCHVPAGTTKYYTLGGRRVAMRKAGTLYYLFTDHLGSTSVTYNTATSQTQTLRYYPWGSVRSGDVPTDRRFTGQRWDATIGLYDYRARFYDPALGRFTQPDTIVPSPGTPQDLNRYSYARNNPQRYTDPTGHCSYDSSGMCVRYTDDGTPQVVRGGSVFVNPLEEAIANAILSGDPDRLLNAIPEGYNGALLARTLEAVFKQLGYADAGTGVGDLALDPFLVIGLASIGGDLTKDALGVGNQVLVSKLRASYPKVIDPRTSRRIPFPNFDLKKVPEELQVSWDSRKDRAAFIEEWHRRGYPEPKGGWAEYDVHHIVPREYGGTNDFWNLAPVRRDIHQQQLNAWWNTIRAIFE